MFFVTFVLKKVTNVIAVYLIRVGERDRTRLRGVSGRRGGGERGRGYERASWNGFILAGEGAGCWEGEREGITSPAQLLFMYLFLTLFRDRDLGGGSVVLYIVFLR